MSGVSHGFERRTKMERKCALAGGAGIDVRAAKLYGCSMAGRPPHGSDPDDWWATTPVAAVDVPRHEFDEDEDWLAAASEDEPRPRRGTGRPRPTVTRRTRVLAAVAAGALVLARPRAARRGRVQQQQAESEATDHARNDHGPDDDRGDDTDHAAEAEGRRPDVDTEPGRLRPSDEAPPARAEAPR